MSELISRLAGLEGNDLEASMDERGWALLPALLSGSDCDALTKLYDRPELFRSQVHMARHGLGRGEYRYFSYPLPLMVEVLRTSLYERLAPLATLWSARLGTGQQFPPDHAAFLEQCHDAGQMRPTPLILRYGEGDYNCLHQDLYGAQVFPLQVAILMSEPGLDFTGGEFVLTEQRPRMQSRVEVVPLTKGDAVVFAVHNRPHRGARGDYRVAMRHGVSRVRSGLRHTLGIIFHDAV